MSFRFATQKLVSGLYEPEGIYLHRPFEGSAILSQAWNDQPEYYAAHSYNGIPLKGHNGVDFIVTAGAQLLAVDPGRVTEVGFERGGFERYLKIEHRWGESLYAFLGEISVDAGQIVLRGASVATVLSEQGSNPFFHLGIRVSPFNRLDGYGGFTDPLPFINPDDFIYPIDIDITELEGDTKTFSATRHRMLIEQANSRRP